MKLLETCCLLLSFAASVFSEAHFFNDGENLSFNDCGKWDPSISGEQPWKATIRDGEGNFCFGFVISNEDIFTITDTNSCRRAVGNFVNGKKETFSAGLGTCFESFSDPNCTQESAGKGMVLKVDAVSRFNFTENLSGYAWQTQQIKFSRDFIWPVCLYNRGKEDDFASSSATQSRYFVASLAWDTIGHAAIVPTEMCETVTRTMQESYLCVNVHDAQRVLGVLLNYHNERFFFRGLGNDFTLAPIGWSTKSPSLFVDILPLVRSIVQHASGIYILPVIPKPQTPKRFKNKNNLSFENCGKSRMVQSKRKRATSDQDIEARGFVVGGRKAMRNKFLWQAQIKFPNHTHGFCSGSLISNRAVLTAAHCLFHPDEKEQVIEQVLADDLDVTVGLYDLHLKNERGVQTKTPVHFVIHPGYNNSTWENDIAILIFENGFNFTDYVVQPICLWNGDADIEQVTGEQSELAGWGLDERHNLPNILHSANLPIRSHEECYLMSRPFFGNNLKPGKNFCAGHTNGTSACVGDSGGGLAIRKNSRWFVRGIVSFGKPKSTNRVDAASSTGCDPLYYSVFTDVSNYLDWIAANAPDIEKYE